MRINTKLLLTLFAVMFSTFGTQYFAPIAKNVAIWGVGPDGKCWELVGTTWQPRGSQEMNSIAAGYDGEVVGANKSGNFCRWNFSKNDWDVDTSSPKIHHIGMSWGEIWAIGKNFVIYKKVGRSWVKQQGLLRRIHVGGTKGNVKIVGTNKNNQVWQWTGSGWKQIGNTPMLDVSVSEKGRIWGVAKNKKVYVWQNNAWKKMEHAPPLIKVFASEKELWGIDSAHKIWQHLGAGISPTNSSRVQDDWENIDGRLMIMAIGGVHTGTVPSHERVIVGRGGVYEPGARSIPSERAPGMISEQGARSIPAHPQYRPPVPPPAPDRPRRR